MTTTYKYLDPQTLPRFANLNLLARSIVEGYISGLHRSPFHGFSVEFAEYREYSPGDDLKHFDWKVYGKSDKSYVKLYQEETNLTAHLLLDCSGSMGYSSDGLTKLEYSCYLAAALAYLMIRQRDSVGIAIIDEEIRERVMPRSSPAHLKRILSVLDNVTAGKETSMAAPFHALAETIKRRGLIIIISDLLEDQTEMLRALRHFRHNKHEVIVFHVFDKHELEFPFDGLIDFRDMETNERMQVQPRILRNDYLTKVNDFIQRYKRECSISSIDYVLVDTSVPYEFLLSSYLSKRSKLG